MKGSHPKKKRPFHKKLALHVVLKSSKAVGGKSFLAHGKTVAKILKTQRQRHSITIYGVANAGNHLHLLLQAPSREHLARFLKAITGRIAESLTQDKGFWDARPFSRIVSWGRQFRNVSKYLGLNATETLGIARQDVKAIFEQIEAALERGLLRVTPGLVAAGFG